MADPPPGGFISIQRHVSVHVAVARHLSSIVELHDASVAIDGDALTAADGLGGNTRSQHGRDVVLTDDHRAVAEWATNVRDAGSPPRAE
jgi:hypothetical protein